MDSFTKELISNASAKLFSDKTLNSSTNFCAGATESGGAMEGCKFGNILPLNVPKYCREEVCFLLKTFKLIRKLLFGKRSLPFY